MLCLIVASHCLNQLDDNSTQLTAKNVSSGAKLSITLEIVIPGDLMLYSFHAFVGEGEVEVGWWVIELLGIKRKIRTLQVESFMP